MATKTKQQTGNWMVKEVWANGVESDWFGNFETKEEAVAFTVRQAWKMSAGDKFEIEYLK